MGWEPIKRVASKPKAHEFAERYQRQNPGAIVRVREFNQGRMDGYVVEARGL